MSAYCCSENPLRASEELRISSFHTTPEVSSDFVGPISQAEELCDESFVKQEVAECEARQEAWLKRKEFSAEGDGNWRPKKRFRVAAFHWLGMLDNQAFRISGAGSA